MAKKNNKNNVADVVVKNKETDEVWEFLNKMKTKGVKEITFNYGKISIIENLTKLPPKKAFGMINL